MVPKTRLLIGTLTLAAAVGAAGLGMQAYAGRDARASMPLAPIFSAADANGDKAVTRDELDTFVRDQFESMDADGDGQVSEDAFESTLAERSEAMRQARFDQLDTNDDGALSPEEFRQANATAGMRRSRATDRGDWLFARLDANDDDALQPIELTAFAERVFARADENADGRVTRDELNDLRSDRDKRGGYPHKTDHDGHWGGGCR